MSGTCLTSQNLQKRLLSGYTLVYRLKSLGECGPRSAQPITKNTRDEKILLDGLLPDSTYDVHVTAHTSQTGPQSNIVIVKTQEAGILMVIIKTKLLI